MRSIRMSFDRNCHDSWHNNFQLTKALFTNKTYHIYTGKPLFTNKTYQRILRYFREKPDSKGGLAVDILPVTTRETNFVTSWLHSRSFWTESRFYLFLEKIPLKKGDKNNLKEWPSLKMYQFCLNKDHCATLRLMRLRTSQGHISNFTHKIRN